MNINTNLNGWKVNGTLNDMTGHNDNFKGSVTATLNDQTFSFMVSALNFPDTTMINVIRTSDQLPPKGVRKAIKEEIKNLLQF